jgi:RNAse (barnase) inhibitor barstar
MHTQLLADLTVRSGVTVHFRDQADVDSIRIALSEKGIAVMEIDGATIGNDEDLYKAFAKSLKMPKGWYGDEEYATNLNAFLEYLDDVEDWVPAAGYLIEFKNAQIFWSKQPRLAGWLVELWQVATNLRDAKPHLVFVW